jgi:TldD protein
VEAVVDHLRKRGVRYGDVRAMATRKQSIHTRDQQADGISDTEDAGVGVRALVGNGWGFASCPGESVDDWIGAADRAVDAAKAYAIAATAPVDLGEAEPHRAHVPADYRIDPFTVPLDRKLGVLFEAAQTLREHEEIVLARGTLSFRRIEKVFGNTEGALITQEEVLSGGGISATAKRGTMVQRRSAPKEWEGDNRRAGWEFIEFMDLPGEAPRVRDEAVALLSAPLCPSGPRDLVIGATQLALQVHESVGHPLELDRVLGTEISLAGGSFAQPRLLESGFRYGSEHVTLIADSLVPGGLGSLAYDDEGVPARRTVLVDRGIFKGYLSGREYAAEAGLGRSSGAMRADSWERPPLVRMVNVNLEPGDFSFDELIGGVDDGIYVDTNRSWSIDDLRLNFHFGCEIGYVIRRGRLTGDLVRDPGYTGITPTFWRACDGVANADSWRLWGLLFCGKGDPVQIMHVGHGVSAARFRGIDLQPLV